MGEEGGRGERDRAVPTQWTEELRLLSSPPPTSQRPSEVTSHLKSRMCLLDIGLGH